MKDWVTQTEAAELRGVSVNVISNWLTRGRLKHSTLIYGRRLVSRSEVLNYRPPKAGRPKQGGG